MKYILFFLLAFGLFGQTKIELDKQTKLDSSNISVVITIPGVGIVPARLDPSALAIVVQPNNQYIITVLPQTPAVVNIQEDKFKPTSDTTVFVCTKPFLGNKSNLTVFYSGILQREVDDYAFTQNGGICTITFNTSIKTGQLITIRYPAT